MLLLQLLRTVPTITTLVLLVGLFWTEMATTLSSSTTVEALRLDFGLPGGCRVSYRDGLLRIQPPNNNNNNSNDESTTIISSSSSPSSSLLGRCDPQTFEVPWDRWYQHEPGGTVSRPVPIPVPTTPGEPGIAIDIEHRTTASKGYGAFVGGGGAPSLPGGSFLGIYEGTLVSSRDDLDRLHARRAKDLLDAGLEEDARKVGDYVMALDGGVHFLDGFDLRYRGNGDGNDNGNDQSFTPAHLNHAEKGDQACNVVRKLVYLPDDFLISDSTNNSPRNHQTDKRNNDTEQHDYPRNLPRVAFFAAREISVGEELAFDYGTNFWK